MNRRNLFSLALALVGLSPLMVLAAEPSTQPVIDSFDSTLDPSGGMTMPMPAPAGAAGASADNKPSDGKPHRGDRVRAGLRFMQPYSSKEVADAMQFLQEHSPERSKFIQALPDGEKKTGIQNFAARAYQGWMRLSKDDFALYAVVLKRVQIEDQIFGMMEDPRSASPDKQSAFNSQLREIVEALVNVGIQERQMRLDNLTHTIKSEQQKLDADSADRSALVEKRLKAILDDDRSGRHDAFKSN